MSASSLPSNDRYSTRPCLNSTVRAVLSKYTPLSQDTDVYCTVTSVPAEDDRVMGLYSSTVVPLGHERPLIRIRYRAVENGGSELLSTVLCRWHDPRGCNRAGLLMD